jgi:hypothetical protein
MTDDKRQAMLTEYQVCQHDNNTSAQNYWLLSSIFIGASSAVLGWLLYALITRPTQCPLNPVVITVISGAMIAILIFLKGWAKRIQYLADRNYERMREIELELGMWKSWRIHSLDRWTELGLKRYELLNDKSVNQIWEKLKPELQKALHNDEHIKKLEMKKDELVQFCNLHGSQKWYEHPSRKVALKGIIFILIGLWVFLILVTCCPVIRGLIFPS